MQTYTHTVQTQRRPLISPLLLHCDGVLTATSLTSDPRCVYCSLFLARTHYSSCHLQGQKCLFVSQLILH